MTDSEGEQLFDIYQELVDGILVDKPAVHVSIGFNPTDFSIAHHSVPQLHSHIYVPVSDLRRTVPTKEMRKFYKLAFVEPFSPVAHDLIKHYLNHQNLQTLDAASCQEGLGFTSFDFDRSEFKNAYGDVRNLYSYLKRCYNDIANIYTDGVSDEATGKFIPVEETQRLERLERFMEETPVQFGSESGRVLSYLAHNLVPAVPRGDDPRELDEPGHIHITRGFSGAFTFRFATDDEQGHFDIAPRIVTTSAVAKTLYGDDRPTEIIKETLLATDEQQTTMQNYKNTVTSIMNNNNE